MVNAKNVTVKVFNRSGYEKETGNGGGGGGTSGYSGYSGAAGISGYSGFSGATGGGSGYSGYSGYSGAGVSGDLRYNIVIEVESLVTATAVYPEANFVSRMQYNGGGSPKNPNLTITSYTVVGLFIYIQCDGLDLIPNWTGYTGMGGIVQFLDLEGQVRSIEQGSFSGCPLTNIYFPRCTNIDSYVFFECEVMTGYDLPMVKSIGSYAFYWNFLATTFHLPSLLDVPSSFMYNNTSVTTLYLPAVRSIGAFAFYQNTALQHVNMPSCGSSVSNSFFGCSAMNSAIALKTSSGFSTIAATNGFTPDYLI
jgi:hypothetical protein